MIFAAVSRVCRDMCQGFLRRLDLARIPALPDQRELDSFAESLTGLIRLPRGGSVRRGSGPCDVEACRTLEHVYDLQEELRVVVFGLKMAARPSSLRLMMA